MKYEILYFLNEKYINFRERVGLYEDFENN